MVIALRETTPGSTQAVSSSGPISGNFSSDIFFLSREKKIIRKIKEAFLAFHIEELLTKDEILELYLNRIELGQRAFGVGAAAQVYFGKNIMDLTLSEIAIIAGLPQAPSVLNPVRSPSRARARRNIVLARMLDEKFITQQEYPVFSLRSRHNPKNLFLTSFTQNAITIS